MQSELESVDVDESELQKMIENAKTKMERISTVKASNLVYLVAYDCDFEPFPEYLTPKGFLKEIDPQYFDGDW